MLDDIPRTPTREKDPDARRVPEMDVENAPLKLFNGKEAFE